MLFRSRTLTQSNVGTRNAQFVLEFLGNEGIRVAARDLEDIYPRKVYYFPRDGRVRVKKLVNMDNRTVFEREAGVYHSPRAGHIDGEVMRIFQTLGLGAEVEAVTVPWKGMRFVNAQGELLVNRPGPSGPGPQAWLDDLYFHQPDLETCLRRGVDRYPNVSVCLRHDVFAVDETPDAILLRVEDLSNGELRQVRARYVIGCDGARSLIRRIIGTRQRDYGLHQPWLVLDLIRTRPDDRVELAAGAVAEFGAELVLQQREFLDGIVGQGHQRTGDVFAVIV